MLFDSLKAVRDSLNEFVPALREKHHLVKLKNGKWTRTLGPPSNARNLRGNVWYAKGVE